jgi:hypothetical protein
VCFPHSTPILLATHYSEYELTREKRAPLGLQDSEGWPQSQNPERPNIQWPQLDFQSDISDIVALEPDETKNHVGRSVPILKGDMRDLLLAAKAKKERGELWPDSPSVFNHQRKKIIDFRTSWEKACNAAWSGE